MVQSKSLVLARRPVGYPIPGEDLIITTSEVDIETPPPDGGLILKTNYISYDPYLRAHMRADFLGDVFPINEVLDEMAISTVISSSSPRFKAGDVVIGYANFSEYQIFSKEATENTTLGIGLTLLKNPWGLDPKVFLGALGMPGITAYSSFYELTKPKKEEVILVSAASGAVGQIVGQLAKREGLKVIGSVGSDEKLKFINEELGFDGGFNYKKEKTGDALKRLLTELGKEGLDIYYDNVGGETLDAALAAMSNFGRIVICGSISQSSKKPEDRYGIKNMTLVASKHLSIRGFIVTDPDLAPKYYVEHQTNMQKWIKAGEIVVKSSVTDGMDNAAEGLVGMLKGQNFGKAILKVADL